MRLTFQFILDSFKNLLFTDFYVMPLVFCSFLLLVSMVKRLKDTRG